MAAWSFKVGQASCLSLFLFTFNVATGSDYIPSRQVPPPITREFRGAWVATVGNIDWPSKPGLTTAQQKAELLAILNRAAEVRLNAVILQIRPSCDALYPSSLEPWSEYLTGRMGQAPGYDPLAFVIDEAHKRGLELHAWFNPFRARHLSARSPVAHNHISKTRPHLVKQYGKLLWLDPGEPAAQEYSMNVILDVVRRYDIDGVHLDDYFYPYRERDETGQFISFPDSAGWKRYQQAGGKLVHDDWRRQNIDKFVERLYSRIKAEKRHVKFGISPFGIWRPGYPAQIQGHDAYAFLFADSRKWLQNGWVDYFAPQLYWDIQPPAQSYPVLLKWWAEQNKKNRHLWPGNAVSRIGLGRTRSVQEIEDQITITRRIRGSAAGGNILWNFKPLLQNRAGISDTLKTRVYPELALAPATPWLDASPPPAPLVSLNPNLNLTLNPNSTDPIRWWIVQTRRSNDWDTGIFDGRSTRLTFKDKPDVIAVASVDRAGNLSSYSTLERATAKHPQIAKTAGGSQPAAEESVSPRPPKRKPIRHLPPKLKS